MNVRALKGTKEHWSFVADALPQLVCLVQRDGRLIRANRTLERWGLGRVGEEEGAYLHDVLHKRCSDPDCYLRLFGERTLVALASGRRTECNAWDPVLARHLEIRTQMSMPEFAPEVAADDFFAIVTVDDVTELRNIEDQSGRGTRNGSKLAGREAQKRAHAEMTQARLLMVLDKTPSLAAMTDPKGALYYLNPPGRVLMGLASQEEVSGMTLVGCNAPGARARIAEEALPAAERDGVWSGDSVLLSRDGREIRSYLTLIAHRNADGRLEGFSLLGRDMSDWVRTEEALRVTQNELWRLSAQHLTIQEGERRRIALDMHDGLGQILSLAKLSIEEAAISVRAGTPERTAKTLEGLAPTVRLALAEVRRISMNLRPATLDDLGIVATLSWYFREFEVTCPNIQLERDISVKESDVPELLKLVIFRIVQEATSNALKHAGADRIKVCLSNECDTIELLIEDTGCGFDPLAAAGQRDFSRGIGLQSMQERAELSGAQYEIHSAPGKGTSICVRWPSQEAFERKLAAMPQPLTGLAGEFTPPDRRLPDRLSACYACLRSFGSQ